MYRGREVTYFGNSPKFCHFFYSSPKKKSALNGLKSKLWLMFLVIFLGLYQLFIVVGGGDGSKIPAFSADSLGRPPYCEMYESTWYFIHNMKIELVRLNIYTDVVSPLLVLPFLWFWGILYNCLEGSFSVPESCQIYKMLFNHFSYSHIPLSEINVQT